MADTKNNTFPKKRAIEEKRIKTAKEANLRNSAKKSAIRTAVKAFKLAVEAKDATLANEKLNTCISLINRAKSDGLYHANSAARKVSSLTRLYNNLNA